MTDDTKPAKCPRCGELDSKHFLPLLCGALIKEPKPAADGAREWYIHWPPFAKEPLGQVYNVLRMVTNYAADDCVHVVEHSALERAEERIRALEHSEACFEKESDQQRERAEKAEAQMREIEWTCGELNAGIVDLRLTLKARERERDDLRAKLAACEEALKPK